MANPVEEVIAAEKEAEKIVKKAEEKRLDIITKAKHEALALLSERQKKTDGEQEAMIKKKAEELERRKDKIRSEGQVKVSQLERSATGNIAKAKEFILKEFEERLG